MQKSGRLQFLFLLMCFVLPGILANETEELPEEVKSCLDGIKSSYDDLQKESEICKAKGHEQYKDCYERALDASESKKVVDDCYTIASSAKLNKEQEEEFYKILYELMFQLPNLSIDKQ